MIGEHSAMAVLVFEFSARDELCCAMWSPLWTPA